MRSTDIEFEVVDIDKEFEVVDIREIPDHLLDDLFGGHAAITPLFKIW